MPTAIEFNNISKQYRLGLVSTNTISHDLNRWWQTSILRKEDPYLKIGESNDRATKGTSEYVWALRDIDFKVEQGDVLGIIGKNGAGKSTLLKILSKVTAPTTGTIRARGRIASLLEVGTGFHPEMTGRENIYMNGAIMGMTKREISCKLDEIIDFAGVERYIDTPTKRYSSGMTVRLGFAIAAHLDPEILVVDEVLAVGDAEFQKKAIGKMQDVSKGEGRTVLFVSHNMAAVRNLCKSGIVLANGTISYVGDSNGAIDFYSENTNSKHITSRIIASMPNKIESFRDVEVLEANLLNKCIFASDEDIVVKIKCKRNNPSIDKATFEMMITNSLGIRVGSYISPFYNIPSEVFEVTFILSKHNLSKGRYQISFNVGQKDIFVGVRDFHLVYDVLTFEVLYTSVNTNQEILVWSNNWGSHYIYSSSEIEALK